MDFAELWWCPGVPRKQPSCHPIWQESRFANFTHLSSQLFASFSKCLPMVLFPPFPLSVLYTTSETGSGSPPPISCSAGGVSVGSAFEAQHSTFTKGFAQGGKTWSWSRNPRVKNFAPFLKSDLKGNGLGCIQLIETVVFVNTPCKQTVFLFQTNIYTTEVWQQKPLKKWCLEDWSGFRLGVFVGLFSGANSC